MSEREAQRAPHEQKGREADWERFGREAGSSFCVCSGWVEQRLSKGRRDSKRAAHINTFFGYGCNVFGCGLVEPNLGEREVYLPPHLESWHAAVRSRLMSSKRALKLAPNHSAGDICS